LQRRQSNFAKSIGIIQIR